MENYFANQPIILTVPLVTSGGITVTDPTNVTYRVVDGKGVEIVASTAIDVTAGTGLAEINIDASANNLAEGEVRAYRQVEVRFETGGASYVNFAEYLIESQDALVVLVNSFQTYADAMLLSAEITGIDMLTQATRRERIAALINAYSVISRLQFDLSNHARSRLYDVNVTTAAPGWTRNGIVNIRSMTLEDYQKLPKDFLNSLCTVQVLEANEALDNFSILKKRQQGLMSETIGESSMMFRPEKVLNVPVTRRSLDLLRPYLVWDMSIGRG